MQRLLKSFIILVPGNQRCPKCDQRNKYEYFKKQKESFYQQGKMDEKKI
jgi:hypothetical protein